MSSLETIRPLYVTDRHSLYWYLTTDKKLSKRASGIFDAAERAETQIVISAIVIAELYWLNKKWRSFDDFGALYHELRNRPEFLFVPLRPEEVLDFDKASTVPEMHDRIIAGLARRLGAPLITVDPLITAAGVAEIVW
jgi:PIN domain nuclease of toxin-antitoxin system